MRRSHAFTLVELLVTLVIIGMLASMILFALFQAQQSAQMARTQAMITKLHSTIARQWDTYATRRPPIDVSVKDPGTDNTPIDPAVSASLRLKAVRQLMRVELPDRWADVAADPTDPLPIVAGLDLNDDGDFSDAGEYSVTRKLPVSALQAAYFQYFQTISDPDLSDTTVVNPSEQFQNAECLYMIVRIGLIDDGDGINLFSEDDVGDVDEDGAPEFIDAWGTPIRFLRWPIGFVNDPRHDEDADTSSDQRIGHLSDLMPARTRNDGDPGADPETLGADNLPDCTPDARNSHDPFDMRGVDELAYSVFPLIHSAGPDKIFDVYGGFSAFSVDDPFVQWDTAKESDPTTNPPIRINSATARQTSCADYEPIGTFDPETTSAARPKYIGVPKDLDSWNNGAVVVANGVLNHYDNIHNHLMDASSR